MPDEKSMKPYVSIWEKYALTIYEAAEYFGIVIIVCERSLEKTGTPTICFGTASRLKSSANSLRIS